MLFGRRRPIEVGVRRLENSEGLAIPRAHTKGSAGLDLAAALPHDNPVKLEPGKVAMIPTGLVIALPEGFEGQVRPRSGLAANFGVTVLNSPGTIDSDYRGEIQVILINHGSAPYIIMRGDRVAQLIIAPVSSVELIELASLDDTLRGVGGYGSTGT
jgi:dUTP pyrophosphatase